MCVYKHAAHISPFETVILSEPDRFVGSLVRYLAFAICCVVTEQPKEDLLLHTASRVLVILNDRLCGDGTIKERSSSPRSLASHSFPLLTETCLPVARVTLLYLFAITMTSAYLDAVISIILHCCINLIHCCVNLNVALLR